ncbi:het domain [Paramyrothecium foliicola]|nr:het domain [Paramyrothecium foliicola]
MRLLHTKEMDVVEVGGQIPPYAALSHTWAEEEVTFQDMEGLEGAWPDLRNDATELQRCTVRTKKGFGKLCEAARLARESGLDYVWIDTCCIDKTSSVELSEAINSMYRWYRDANICYSYLSDVPPAYKEDIFVENSCFRRSKWFTRGWTLQELIAPKEVEFFAQDWSYLGNKQQSNQFISLLHSITGIQDGILRGTLALDEVSIASRMAWAASRQTARIEDLSYCLMGIFDVNMPLLYGEGCKAFFRLQQEILLKSDDQSIFAWSSVEQQETPIGNETKLRGLLADSPQRFKDMGQIDSIASMRLIGTPWEWTNKGLKVEFCLQLIEDDSAVADYSVKLSCEKTDKDNIAFPFIQLRRLWGDQFARIHASRVDFMKPDVHQKASFETVFVKQHPSIERRQMHITAPQDYEKKDDATELFSFRLIGVYPLKSWDPVSRILSPRNVRLGTTLCIFRFEICSSGSTLLSDVAVGLRETMQGASTTWCAQITIANKYPTLAASCHRVNEMPAKDPEKLNSEVSHDIDGTTLPTTASVLNRHMRGNVEIQLHLTKNEDATVPPELNNDKTNSCSTDNPINSTDLDTVNLTPDPCPISTQTKPDKGRNALQPDDVPSSQIKRKPLLDVRLLRFKKSNPKLPVELDDTVLPKKVPSAADSTGLPGVTPSQWLNSESMGLMQTHPFFVALREERHLLIDLLQELRMARTTRQHQTLLAQQVFNSVIRPAEAAIEIEQSVIDIERSELEHLKDQEDVNRLLQKVTVTDSLRRSIFRSKATPVQKQLKLVRIAPVDQKVASQASLQAAIGNLMTSEKRRFTGFGQLCYGSRAEKVQACIDRDSKYVEDVSNDFFNFRPIHCAVARGSLEIVGLLHAHGASLGI